MGRRGRCSLVFVLVVVTVVVVVVAGGDQGDDGDDGADLASNVVKTVAAKTGFRLSEMYLPVHVEPQSDCGRALTTMVEGLTGFTKEDEWAYRMVDSWGKNRDGTVFVFLAMFHGFYDECLATRSPNNSFTGRFCTIGLYPPKEEEQQDTSTYTKIISRRLQQQHGFEPGAGWPGFGPGRGDLGLTVDPKSANGDQRLAPVTVTFNVKTVYGTCIPSVCTEEQLMDSLNVTFNDRNWKVVSNGCGVLDQKPEFIPADSFIIIVSLLFLVVLVASILDIYIKYSGNKTLPKGGVKYLLPFSAYTNLDKMFHLNTTSSTSNISCLHGIRVLSMMWVIYCHQQSATFYTGFNWESIFERSGGILFQIILNGYSSVDSFFFLSGLLVTYSVLRQAKTGKFNIFVFYIHRIIRLVPAIALVSWLYASVARFYVDGPYSHTWLGGQKACQEGWWKDVLFVNNFVDTPSCLAQTWYIAVDTQLYLVAPLLILPLVWFKRVGEMWLYFATLISMVVPAAVTYANDFPPEFIMTNEDSMEYMEKLYVTPWCRAGPWVIGIWIGYILHRQGSRKIKIPPLLVMVGWSLATVTGLLVVFGIWSYNTFTPVPYDVMTAVVYGGVHRSAWAAALGWIVFACYNGYGGIVDGFLSHPNWQPLSRLTFSIYLVCLHVQLAITANARISFYSTYVNKVVETVGALMVSLPIAVLVSLLAESPVLGLEKLLLAPARSPARKGNETPDSETAELQDKPEIPLVVPHGNSYYHNAGYSGTPEEHNGGFSTGVTKF